jgi:hypothetical protein
MTAADFRLKWLRADAHAKALEFTRALAAYYKALREAAPPEEREAAAASARREGESYVASLDELIAHLQNLKPKGREADELERALLSKGLALREIDLTR